MSLSAILINYNHKNYLATSLQALVTQSYPAEEIVVVDDASTDGSVDFLLEWQKKYKQIKVIQNPKNLGPAQTIKRGLLSCTSEYIVLCAADDFVLPGFFENSIKALERNKNFSLAITTPAFFYGNNTDHIYRKKFRGLSKDCLITKEEIESYFKYSGLWVPSHSVMYRKKIFSEYGYHDEKLSWMCDWYINHLVALKEGVIFIKESGAALRILDSSYSHKKRSLKEKFSIYSFLMQKIQKESPCIRKKINKCGILGLQKNSILSFLLLHPKYWHYLPWVFRKKWQKLIEKSKRAFY